MATFLVLGGCGFIGRNLVKHLLDKKAAIKIRVADKSMPATSYFAPEHKAAFDTEIVEFVQCDLTREAHIAKAFKDLAVDYVINLCGETRFGMAAQEYLAKSVEPVVKGVPAAAKAKVKKWVEMSTAQIYKPNSKKPADEKAPLEPWTSVAKYRLEAEKKLITAAEAAAMPFVILRPSYVYGKGDLNSITPRIVCAAVYQDRKEKMKFLWGEKLKLNTVHVEDVCEATLRACTTYDSGSIYNLSDPGDSDQGKVNKILGGLFGIKVEFYGGTVSKMAASVGITAIVQQANDKHVPGWTKICKAHELLNTPISPYLDGELLRNNSLHIDGSAITKADKDFAYKHKACNEAELAEVIKFFIAQGIFPPVLKEKAK